MNSFLKLLVAVMAIIVTVSCAIICAEVNSYLHYGSPLYGDEPFILMLCLISLYYLSELFKNITENEKYLKESNETTD